MMVHNEFLSQSQRGSVWFLFCETAWDVAVQLNKTLSEWNLNISKLTPDVQFTPLFSLDDQHTSLYDSPALTNIGGGSIDHFGCRKSSCNLTQASLTKFHEQGEEDPQRDLKRLPDVVVVDGEDGESLFVRSGVSLMMGVLIWHRGWTSPRLVGSRNSTATRGGGRNQKEQQNTR